MQLPESNEFLHPNDLASLARLRSDGPVFSLYIDLRDGQNPLARFEQLLAEAEQQRKLDQDPPEYREQWQQEAEWVRRWLQQEPQRQAPGGPKPKGLAVLSSQAAGLWQALPLLVAVPDRLIVSDLPYLRPLAILQAEFPCTLAVLIDSGTARLVQVFLGLATEIERLESVPVTGDVMGDPFSRYVAERTVSAWGQHPCGALMICGTPEAVQALRSILPEDLQGMLVEVDPLSPQAGFEELLARVQTMEDEEEQNLEAQRVEELLTRAESGEGAVLGLEQALLAVRSKKIRMLIAEEDFHREGGECPNCGFLGEESQQPCLLCGMALRPEPDLIEVALKRVLDQGGEIDILRSPGSRHALQSDGRIGALLKEVGSRPPVRNTSNQQTLASGGKLNPEAIHDEAVEESFPASDPPGNW